jgi:hypothetical protein
MTSHSHYSPAELVVTSILRKGCSDGQSLRLVHQVVMQIVPQQRVQQHCLAHVVSTHTGGAVQGKQGGANVL